jgi:hypothetical protein
LLIQQWGRKAIGLFGGNREALIPWVRAGSLKNTNIYISLNSLKWTGLLNTSNIIFFLLVRDVSWLIDKGLSIPWTMYQYILQYLDALVKTFW